MCLSRTARLQIGNNFVSPASQPIYCVPRKSGIILYNLLYKIGQDFLNIQYQYISFLGMVKALTSEDSKVALDQQQVIYRLRSQSQHWKNFTYQFRQESGSKSVRQPYLYLTISIHTLSKKEYLIPKTDIKVFIGKYFSPNLSLLLKGKNYLFARSYSESFYFINFCREKLCRSGLLNEKGSLFVFECLLQKKIFSCGLLFFAFYVKVFLVKNKQKTKTKKMIFVQFKSSCLRVINLYCFL